MSLEFLESVLNTFSSWLSDTKTIIAVASPVLLFLWKWLWKKINSRKEPSKSTPDSGVTYNIHFHAPVNFYQEKQKENDTDKGEK